MGVQTTQLELRSPVPPEKMFRGLVLEIDNIVHKAAPGAYKNVDVKGDGGPGTIKHITLGDDSPYKTMTLRTEAIDKQAMTVDVSVIEGDLLLGIIEKVENHLKVAPAPGGGSICTTTSKYHTKGDAVVPQENLKFADEQNTKLFRAIEAYLLAN
ncbi:dau c 1 isoallergen Dau c 1.0301 [Daucus carota subsp. sativus]|uniref:dau c 1 isoallergen Dau c 1.0301 n=1 Tax=Daucus carota subsp. sativus TaxID=79200 RepID=UPI0007DFC0E4|nr:PREDICTED: major allergen Api g 1, isoallergen 1-like [Daucus carota subsp. sativus]